jgi:hypothetical protein
VTKTTVVTCTADDAANNRATPITFRVTVLGVHDQIDILENKVRTADLTQPLRAALLRTLVRADRAFAAGKKSLERSQLSEFIAKTLHLPATLARTPTSWITAATRILSVSA